MRPVAFSLLSRELSLRSFKCGIARDLSLSRYVFHHHQAQTDSSGDIEYNDNALTIAIRDLMAKLRLG